MTSFAKASFDVASYLASRPTYPPRIFDIIAAYHAHHGGRFDRALDIGCGPGFVALALAPRFRSVLALDPSEGMIAKGLQPADPSVPRIAYRVGSAEALGEAGVGEGEDGVDLVVAGQAAHWFDYPKLWRQLTRRVRPGGTVAFIGYAEMTFPHHPSLNQLIATHSRGTGPDELGPYWQPGRKIVEALLDPVPFPVAPTHTAETQRLLASLPPLGEEGHGAPIASTISEPVLESLSAPDSADTADPADSLKPSSWDPATAVRLKSSSSSPSSSTSPAALGDPSPTPWLMRKSFDPPNLEAYLRSFSALHEYHEGHPEDKAKRGTGVEPSRPGRGSKRGDIVDRLAERIWAGFDADGGAKGGEKQGEVEVGWPLVLFMIKKRA